MARIPAVLVLCWSSSGCGILVQTAFGWSSQRQELETRTHQLRIESEPEGAQVTRAEKISERSAQRAERAETGGRALSDRGPKIVGVTPVLDQVDYQVERTISTPHAWGLLGTGLAELIAGAVLIGVGSTRDGQCIVEQEIQCSNGGRTGFFVGGGAALAFGGIDLIWGITRAFQKEEVLATHVSGEQTYRYEIEKDGVTKSAEVAVPTANGARIDLGSGQVIAVSAPPPPPPPAPDARVVAVMDVEDANGDGEGAVGENLVKNLSDQLRIFVAQQGIQTIDRSAQVHAMKVESYQSCYDESCQIELGKALAASHLLRSKITKFGSRCVLNGELVDLTREVTIKAVSAQGVCEAEGFLAMGETIARDLMKP